MANYVPIPDGQEIFTAIAQRLGDRWHCLLISNATPGIVRLQLCGALADPLDDYPWRKCIPGRTLDEAIEAADEFTHRVTVDEYDREWDLDDSLEWKYRQWMEQAR